MADRRHGGPYDRGMADAYYRRARKPHYYEGATYTSKRVGLKEMAAEEVAAYEAGWADQFESGDFKDWGEEVA